MKGNAVTIYECRAKECDEVKAVYIPVYFVQCCCGKKMYVRETLDKKADYHKIRKLTGEV